MSLEKAADETLHDRIQAGYLLIRLKAEGLIVPTEVRAGLALLFPDLLPAPAVA